jgi:hypothetical protein
MPSIHYQIDINCPAELVWDAVRDAGNLHARLVPGFVVDCALEPDGAARIVTFANGTILREVIVDCDDERRRLVWAIKADNVDHHNGVMQIFDHGGGKCRAVWTADVLPATIAQGFSGLMAQGLVIMKGHLEGQGTP